MTNIKTLNFNMYINYVAVAYAFILPLSRAGISLFSIIFVLLWIIEGNFQEKWEKIKNNKVLFSFLLFIGFSIISIIWTDNLSDAKKPLRMLTYFFVLYVLATSIKKSYINHIITAFLLGMFVSEVISYGVYFEWWQFKAATPQNPSPFMYHIDYSVFLAFTSILLLNRVFSTRYTHKEKILLLVFFVTVTGNLFIGIGRTGQVAFIAGVIVMSVIHFKLSFKAILISILVLFSIFTLAYNVSDNFNARVNQGLGDVQKIKDMDFKSSWGTRVAYWITTFEIVKENPLIGKGIGDYLDVSKNEIEKVKYNPEKFSKKFISTHGPHNQFLLIALQTGMLGLVIFFYFIYTYLHLPIENREWKETSILFMTIFSASCMADTFLLLQFPVSLFSLFVGIFIASSFDDMMYTIDLEKN